MFEKLLWEKKNLVKIKLATRIDPTTSSIECPFATDPSVTFYLHDCALLYCFIPGSLDIPLRTEVL